MNSYVFNALSDLEKSIGLLSDKNAVIIPYGTVGRIVEIILRGASVRNIYRVDNYESGNGIISEKQYCSVASSNDYIIIATEHSDLGNTFFERLKSIIPVDHIIRMYDFIAKRKIDEIENAESYDYYSATTTFMVNNISRVDSKIVFSLGGRVQQIVPLLGMLDRLYHCSVIRMKHDIDLRNLPGACDFIAIYEDFFNIEHRKEFDEINIVISHACIHCLNDTRYFNNEEEFRSYKVARRINELFPNVNMVILSAAVNKMGCIKDNSSFLCEEQLVESFLSNGFFLDEKFYDLECGMEHVYCVGDRFLKNIPDLDVDKYVIGNYCFTK